MPKIALSISYDGRDWLGWQTQPSGKTIQDQVEKAISAFLGSHHPTICAGRTDAGVHAISQVIHLDTEILRESHSWVRGLNAHLPPSIAVQWAKQVPDDFHARFSARSRSYIYVIHQSPIRQPLFHGRAGWVYQPLDESKMESAMTFILGEHDFSSFRSSQCQAVTPVRTILNANLTRKQDLIILEFCANAFLHHMVRNLVGALVLIGQGRKPVSYMQDLLNAKDRTQGAPTFSPAGLYFQSASYPGYELPSNMMNSPLFGV
jgi:tRNA pseudouridine38-40 synthase